MGLKVGEIKRVMNYCMQYVILVLVHVAKARNGDDYVYSIVFACMSEIHTFVRICSFLLVLPTPISSA